jgi:hypothetical protein
MARAVAKQQKLEPAETARSETPQGSAASGWLKRVLGIFRWIDKNISSGPKVESGVVASVRLLERCPEVNHASRLAFFALDQNLNQAACLNWRLWPSHLSTVARIRA